MYWEHLGTMAEAEFPGTLARDRFLVGVMNFHRAKTYELIERISTGGMHGGMRKDWRSRGASSGSVRG